jgi:predicted nuclease of restriction endonuclease-like RecB superfamily
MGLQGGGEKVFPSDLMIARKTKNGLIFPVFLSDENSDYLEKVRSIFVRNKGNKKETIVKELKELEVNSSSTKTVRALSLVFFRNSVFEPPVKVDSMALREDVFRAARIPPVSAGEKHSILVPIEEKYGLDFDGIMNGLYADKESELILTGVYDGDPMEISRKYNMEQLETIMGKCSSLAITSASNWSYLITSIKRLGLLYSTNISGTELKSIVVTGPLNIFENPDRYASRFAQLMYKITRLEKWSIEGDIKVKDKFDKTVKMYKLNLSDAVSYYLPQVLQVDSLPYNFVQRADPLIVDGEVYFPDYVIKVSDRDVYINITSKYLSKRDDEIKRKLKGKVYWENIYVLDQKDKKVKDGIIFYGDIDFQSLRSLLQEKYSGKKQLNSELDDSSIGSIKKELEKLYPDTEKMFAYIESQGLVPERVLPAMGYKLKWRGLDIIVVKKD